MDLLKILNSNKEIKHKFDEDYAFLMSQNILRARIIAGFTQKQLAKEVGTSQSNIARIESGKTLPSLTFLTKLAKAMHTKLVLPTFESIQDKQAIKVLHFPVIMASSDTQNESLNRDRAMNSDQIIFSQ